MQCNRTAIYFFAIGLGFMFVEIAFMQKLTLYLAHPLYAVAVVLASFLVFAGLGSATVPPQGGRGPGRAVAGIVAVSTVYLMALPLIFELTLGWPEPLKVAMAVSLIAPLAFFMGRPFPSALAALSERWPHLVPWVWGINGCASVVGAVAAMLVAVHAGLTVVSAIGALFYGLAALAYPARSQGGGGLGETPLLRRSWRRLVPSILRPG